MAAENSERHFPIYMHGFEHDFEPISVTPDGAAILEGPLASEDNERQSFKDRFLGLKEKITNIYRSAKEDVSDSDNKLITAASGLGVLAVEAIGATKLPTVKVPAVSMSVLAETGSPLKAGVAAAGLYGAWCLSSAKIFDNAFNRFPKAAKTAEESFPKIIGNVSDSLPGLEQYKSTEGKKPAIAKRIGQSACSHAGRGVVSVVIGILPYVAGASAKGQDKKERSKLTTAIGVDGGAISGLALGSVAYSIAKLSYENPELAEKIQDGVGNMKYWYAAAGIMMVSQWAKNRFMKNKQTQSV